MSEFSGFAGLFAKEVRELTREKRLFVILTIVGVLLSVPFSFYIRAFGFGWTPSYGDFLMPLVYVGPIVLIVVSLTFAADCVSKERDSGMLGLVLSSPVTTEGFLAAKVAGACVAYAAVAGFVLLFLVPFGLSFGWAPYKAAILLFLIPFLAYWLFLLGISLVVSVVMGGSKSAVGVAIALYMPLFFLQQQEPGFGFLIRELSPRIYEWLEYNPMGMSIATAEALVYGEPFAWAPVAVSAVLGALLLLGAWAIFRRQEVAA